MRFLLWMSSLCKRAVLYTAFILLLCLSIFCFTEQAFMPMNKKEQILFQQNGLLFFTGCLAVLGILVWMNRILHRISAKKLFFFLAMSYFMLGLYLILHTDPEIRSDALKVYQCAAAMNQGDYSAFDAGGYLFFYPHQLGLVTFERILLPLSSQIGAFFFWNLLMMLSANYMIWRISALQYGENSLICKYTMILSFLFFPQLFFILFVYGQFPGLCCLLIAFLFYLKYKMTERNGYAVIIIVFTAAAAVLRNNYLIGAIALILVLCFDALDRRRLKSVMYAAAVLVCVMISGQMLRFHYETVSGKELGEGIPKMLWVVMGLQDAEDSERLGGWYNEYTKNVYQSQGYDKDTSILQGKEDLSERLKDMKNDPKDALSFFERKIRSTWCDPLFQSVWSGPLEDVKQYTHTFILKSIYRGEELYRWLAGLANIIVFFIYAFCCVFLVKLLFFSRAAVDDFTLFGLLLFIGFFLFHLAWETKSQYVWPSVILLIPCAAKGMVWSINYRFRKEG